MRNNVQNTYYALTYHFGSLNINDRMYDPLLGCFLSLDKYVQKPQLTQSFNRYSYCMNNPLNVVDPSGWWGSNTSGGAGEKNYYYLPYYMYGRGQGCSYYGRTIADWALAHELSNDAWIYASSPRGSYNSNLVNSGSVSFSRCDYYVNTDGYVDGKLVSHSRKLVRSEVIATNSGGGFGNVVSGVGFAGSVASNIDGTFRLVKSGSFSPGYYSSGWSTGNQYVKNLYSVSKVGSRVSTGASIISTGMAYNQIIKGNQTPITYADATVGTLGLSVSAASYFTGVQIPIIGEFVAIYGAARLGWDIGWNFGVQYGPSTWFKPKQPESRVIEYMRQNGMFDD